MRCLDSLLSVTASCEWEVVVVDNGSSDGTGDYLLSLTSRSPSRPGQARLITVSEFKPGLATARNKGWLAASAEIVAFTDDDCYVSEDYVKSILQVFSDNPEAGFLGGRILLHDPTDYKITIEESRQQRYFRPMAFVPTGAIQGANMAFRRVVLEQIGGFDERFGAGTEFPCEDIDAVAAALWAGIPGLYDPRPIVFHHHGRKTKVEADDLMQTYDKGRGAYYAKYVLGRASRQQYVRAWMQSAKEECTSTIRRGRLPRMSLREVSSGLRFALSEFKSLKMFR